MDIEYDNKPKEKKKFGTAIGIVSGNISSAVRDATKVFDKPRSKSISLLDGADDYSNLDEENDKEKKINKFDEYIESQPKTLVDGMFQGFLSIGKGVVTGVSGIVIEPVKGASKNGASGFVRGIGKGFAGVVIKPVAWAVDFVGKSAEGLANTPGTIYSVMNRRKKFEAEEEPIELKTETLGFVFGVPLEETLYNYGPTHIIYLTLNYLRNHLSEEGIFRISGNKVLVEELKAIFDSTPPLVMPVLTSVTAEGSEGVTCHEIASLLKLYLRQLPEPLLTFDRQELFLGVVANSSVESTAKLATLKNLIEGIPAANKQALKSILQLLNETSQQPINKMTAMNLAVVFGPCLLGDSSSWSSVVSGSSQQVFDPQKLLQSLTQMNNVVINLIEGYNEIFPEFVNQPEIATEE